MPKQISAAEVSYAIGLMVDGMGQRDMAKKTGLSRPYLRKLAKQIGHQFPRNGKEVIPQTCVCTNCGVFFRRSASKIKRAEKSFCDEICKFAYMKGG